MCCCWTRRAEDPSPSPSPSPERSRADLRDEHLLGDGGAHLDRVLAVGHDLGLDDGHEPVLLLRVLGRGMGLGFVA